MSKSILEHNPDEFTKFDADHPLTKTVQMFIWKYGLNNSTVIISLSGGVDSMVLASIVRGFSETYGIKLIAAHLNYGNRPETHQEAAYLRCWCQDMDIKLEIREITEFKRAEIDRAVYEKETARIRFEFYRECVEKHSAIGVLYGHHADDVVENVITNFFRSRDLHDLVVMHDTVIKEHVKIFRPMLPHHKVDIYDYARKNNVPWFLDTTPSWSNRYKLRQQLLPLLREMYGKNVDKAVLTSAETGEEWKELIDQKIISKFMRSVSVDHDEINVMHPIALFRYCDKPFVWSQFLRELFAKHGYRSISRKALGTLMQKLEKLTEFELVPECDEWTRMATLTLQKGLITKLSGDVLIFKF